MDSLGLYFSKHGFDLFGGAGCLLCASFGQQSFQLDLSWSFSFEDRFNDCHDKPLLQR